MYIKYTYFIYFIFKKSKYRLLTVMSDNKEITFCMIKLLHFFFFFLRNIYKRRGAQPLPEECVARIFYWMFSRPIFSYC